MTRRRDIRTQRRAASERDYSWQELREQDEQRENAPDEEHYSADDAADAVKGVRE